MTFTPSYIIPCIYTIVFTPLLLLLSSFLLLLLLLYHQPSPPPSLSQPSSPPLSPSSSGLLSSIFGFNDNYQKPYENKKGGPVRVPDSYNLYDRDPSFNNKFGWSISLDEHDYKPPKDSDVRVFLVNLTAASMLVPHVNPEGNEYGVVLEGKGTIQVVDPNGTSAMKAKVNEGEVFWIPRFFPFYQYCLKRRSIGVLRVHNLCKGGGNLEVPRFDYNQFLHCFSNEEGVVMFEEVGRRLKEVGTVDPGDMFSVYEERMATRDRRMRAKFSSGCFQDNGGDSLINMENTHIIYLEKFQNSTVIDTEHFQA